MKPLSVLQVGCVALAAWIPASALAKEKVPDDVGAIPKQMPARDLQIENGDASLPEVGRDHRVVRTVQMVEDGKGGVTTNICKYVEIATGLMRINERGEWEPTTLELELIPGFCISRKTAHQVAFSQNMNQQGAVTITTPDGQILRATPVGLALVDDSSKKSVLIAKLQDSKAYQVGDNRVVFLDAFDGVAADVRYTVTRSMLEQDIVLKQNISFKSIEELGLNPQTTYLQILTEFYGNANPTKRLLARGRGERVFGKVAISHGAPDTSIIPSETSPNGSAANPRTVEKDDRLEEGEFLDEELTFGTTTTGAMTMGPGRAFQSTKTDSDDLAIASGFPVSKQWSQTDDGRTILSESIAFEQVATATRELPFVPIRSVDKTGAQIGPQRIPPPIPSERVRPDFKAHALKYDPTGSAEGQIAKINYRPNGFVVDFQLLSGTYNSTPLVLYAGETYSVSDEVIVGSSSSLVIQGGAVIKVGPFFGTANPRIRVLGSLKCETSPWRPATFTCRDDDSVGEILSTSTHTISGYYGYGLFVDWSAIAPTIMHCKFRSLNAGMQLAQNTTVRHCTFDDCNAAVEVYGCTVNLGNAGIRGYRGIRSGNGFASCEHATFLNLTGSIFERMDTLGSATLKNCLIVNSPAAINSSVTILNPQSSPSVSSAALQTVGQGRLYLANGSPYRNVGTLDITPSLAAELKSFTTYPPLVMSGILSINTVWSPIAPPDFDLPDLGYHYPIVDYLVNALTVQNATLLLTNGVSVGVGGATGFLLRDGGSLVAEGSPTAMNHLFRTQSVQEGIDPTPATGLIDSMAQTFVKPTISLRFTDVSVLSGSLNRRSFVSDGPSSTLLDYFNLRDCELYGVNIGYNDTSASRGEINWLNNLFVRSTISLQNGGASAYRNFNNNLFWNGSVTLNRGASAPPWIVKNNVFDNAAVTVSGQPLTLGYNGFVGYASAPTGLYDGPTSILVSSFPYANGPLGSWYHGARTFADLGSELNAGTMGLYHYTVFASQEKEANGRLDIGFHRVALAPSAPPLEGLIGYWDFEEPDVSSILDRSGSGFSGVNNGGALHKPGVIGSALSFDGINDSVTFPSSTLLAPSQMTVSLWVRKDVEKANWVRFIGKGSTSSRTFGVWDYAGAYAQTFFQSFTPPSGYYGVTAATLLVPGMWYHLAYSFDGTTYRSYVNGIPETQNNGTAPLPANGDPIEFGSHIWSDYFQGALDEVRLYNRVLKDLEITSLVGTVPADTDHDGSPDYLEDRNGDGSSSGETDWIRPPSDVHTELKP